jgi:glycosyltransferase involved in cell wall biosynthesis
MKGKGKIIVSVTNDLYTDQRVHKVCSFLHENGFHVTLIGRKLKNSPEMPKRDYDTKRMKLWFNKGPFFYANFNFRLFIFLLFNKADKLLSNDLDTLLANFLAKKFKKNCELVYDSHELYTEVPELINRPKVRSVWLKIEKWIFPKLKKVYTVNHSIANIYEDKYKVKVHVVRNVSPLWKPENILSKNELKLPLDKKIIILQGAGINIDRGAEEAVEAMQYVEDAVFIIVGSGDVIADLKNKVIELQLSDKVLFYDRQPYDRLMYFTYHADLGLTLDKNTNANYQYSLPNKVFDYVHAGTPILASNLTEISDFISKFKVGEIVNSHEPREIAKSINAILFDDLKMNEYKANCKLAAETENWENECQVLAKIFLS